MRLPLLILLISLSTSSADQKRVSSREQQDCNLKNPSTQNLFSWVDYTVLTIMLLVSCLIGTFYVFFGKKQETGGDFLLGGSNMGTYPMAMSLAASFVTAIELLGNPAEMYSQGTQFWMTCLSFVLIVPIATTFYLPVYMKLRLTSSYEYLNLRFNSNCRLLASILYMLQMTLYSSVAVYAPALALSHVTGLDTYLAVTLVYIVCIFYASQGGMKAVIMTDTFQGAVLLLSLFVVFILGMIEEGGITPVWQKNERTGRIQFFNTDPSPTVRHSIWSVVIGGTFYWATLFCSNQASIQKYLSVKSFSQVKTALWVSSSGLILVYTINFLTGMVLYSQYSDCDPLKAGYINDRDQILPWYVMNSMGSKLGVPGLFVAGIFAASLGTVASSLNSLAAITCEDIIQGLVKINVPANKIAIYARWISIFFGILSFASVFIVERLGGVLQVALSFNGMVGGVILGLFSLGMFIPWSNAKGAMTGAIAALISVCWIGLGAQVAMLKGEIHLDSKELSIRDCPCINQTTHNSLMSNDLPRSLETWSLYRISYLWYSMIGCLVTMSVGTIVSFITGARDPTKLDINLLSPPVRYLLGEPTQEPNCDVKGITNYALELMDETIANYGKKNMKTYD